MSAPAEGSGGYDDHGEHDESTAHGRHRSLGPMDLVVWECAVHGVVDEWPDDGSPESKGTTSPHFPVCPGPWDEDLNNWTYKCERQLRRRVHTD
jgi:hypothetical protein